MSRKKITIAALHECGQIERNQMGSCCGPNCPACAVHGEYQKETFDRMLQLVGKTLCDDGLGVAPIKHKNVVPIFKVEKHQTQEVLLNPAMRCYLHKAVSGRFQTKQNNQLVSKIYVGPCGIVSVFAARDDFDASGVKIVRDPDMVTCKYNKHGTERQNLFVIWIPLRYCSYCHKSLSKSYKCSRCREIGVHARYCSRACQVEHWPVHKQACGGVLLDAE